MKVIEDLGLIPIGKSTQRYRCVLVECEYCPTRKTKKKTSLKGKKVYVCKPCSARENLKKATEENIRRGEEARKDPELVAERKARRRKLANEASARYRKRNSERINDYHYIKNYGMTREEALKLKESGCFICGSVYRPVIDHCHKTGEVRGVLCDKHNKALGLLGDTLEDVVKMLSKMRDYLEKFEAGVKDV
jgi:hypothetical protein